MDKKQRYTEETRERASLKKAKKDRIKFEEKDQVEGKNAVLEALRSGRPINKLLISSGIMDSTIGGIINIAEKRGIVFQYTDKSNLDRLSLSRAHQGVIAITSPKEYTSPEEILKFADARGERPFIVILDGVTDHNNLGSIIRTAECVGAHGIILPKRRSAALSTTVFKVSAGAAEYLNVARVTNLVRTIKWLKDRGIWVIGAAANAEQNFYDADFKVPIALVLGSEGSGIRRLVLENCDAVVKIPMKGNISSLNVGVAAAVIMYEVLKQRDSEASCT